MNEFRWRAIYKDGSILPQYCKCGFQKGYENIDRTKLSAFDIYSIDNKEKYTEHDLKTGKLIFRMFLEEGQKLIYRRRVQKEFSVITGEEKAQRYVYMVGHQQKVNGKNTQVINYIFQDGHIEQAGRWVGGIPELKEYEI